MDGLEKVLHTLGENISNLEMRLEAVTRERNQLASDLRRCNGTSFSNYQSDFCQLNADGDRVVKLINYYDAHAIPISERKNLQRCSIYWNVNEES